LRPSKVKVPEENKIILHNGELHYDHLFCKSLVLSWF
jgi:hypothetical protein